MKQQWVPYLRVPEVYDAKQQAYGHYVARDQLYLVQQGDLLMYDRLKQKFEKTSVGGFDQALWPQTNGDILIRPLNLSGKSCQIRVVTSRSGDGIFFADLGISHPCSPYIGYTFNGNVKVLAYVNAGTLSYTIIKE
jgi:hypothetical protein